MAPLKTLVNRNLPGANAKRTSITTRSRSALADIENKNVRITKRKADCSPIKEVKSTFKRSALSDLPKNSNVLPKKNGVEKPTLKPTLKAKQTSSIKTVAKLKNNENVPPNAPGVKTKTRLPVKTTFETETIIKTKVPLKETNGKVKRLSNEFEKTEVSLYSTALEDLR